MAPARPLLSPWYRVVASDDRLLLEFGGECVTFEGRAATALLPALLPLLDGTRTVAEVATQLELPSIEPVTRAVALLAEHGLVVEGPPVPTSEPAPFVQAAHLHAALLGSVSPAGERSRLRSARVDVVGNGTLAPEIARLLRRSGVGAVERTEWRKSPSGELAVVAPGPGESARLAGWNESALADGREWLQVAAWDGSIAVVGPVFVPGETCCWECYRRRRRSHLAYGDDLELLETSPSRAPSPPGLTACVAGLTALVALRRLFGDPLAAGAAIVLELGESVRLGAHLVPRVPRCPTCSRAARVSQPLPWAAAS